MRFDDVLAITKQEANVDGEKVYIIDKENGDLDEIISKTIFMKDKNYTYTLLYNDLNFIRNHDNFTIIFRLVYKKYDGWLPCMVYYYNGVWQKVVLQYSHCTMCDWNGLIANPAEASLYDNISNRFEILKKINKFFFLCCPKCKSQLDSKAIWLENKLIQGTVPCPVK